MQRLVLHERPARPLPPSCCPLMQVLMLRSGYDALDDLDFVPMVRPV